MSQKCQSTKSLRSSPVRGGATINPDPVKVMYLRTPNVDPTLRVEPFIQAVEIDVPEAEPPAGEYTIRVDIKDSDAAPAPRYSG